MYCVGLTGTIASGKSTVANFFAELGVAIISADKIAKALTMPGEAAFQQIVMHFGDDILTKTGELNRRKLRDIIFKQPEERLWLEQLLHPLIRKKIATDVHQLQTPYCLIEIPLLFNRSDYPYLNRVLLVLSKSTQQRARLISRDQTAAPKAAAILKTQASEQAYRALSDDILNNNGSLEQLKHQVYQLNKLYLKLSCA